MRILFTNDDGYDSQGLHAVADLFKNDFEIAVVAPNNQRSGFSHSLSLKPATVAYKKVSGYDYPVYALDGTPVDCVKFGLIKLFKADIIVSGINRGQNLGSDVMYSGTVSAAQEGAFMGVKSFALSQKISLNGTKHDNPVDFMPAARFFYDNFEALCSVGLPQTGFLNINYPFGGVKGYKFARMNTQLTFIAEYTDASNDRFYPTGARNLDGLYEDADEWLCRNGYITITPLVADRTHYSTLEKLKGTNLKI